MKLAFIFGTRPEAIKLAPLILAARKLPYFEPLLVSTGQHTEMLDQVLDFFQILPDYALQVMTPGQTLARLTSTLLEQLDSLIARERPDAVVVQGDTTTAMCGALVAFYQRVPIAHVEAGLRTNCLDAPFPEEMNRRVISQVARWHFVPTRLAASTLHREAVDLLGGTIIVTGNTVIDALLDAATRVQETMPEDPDLHEAIGWLQSESKRELVLVTGHRRESFGAGLRSLCQGLRRLAEARPQARVIYPVHLNPNVREPVHAILSDVPNIRLTAPKRYPVFIRLMVESSLIITDSGGVQEEAPALGKRVLITREHTERPEAVAAGVAELVGTDPDRLVSAALSHLTSHSTSRPISPFGDGQAARRCLDVLQGLETDEFCPMDAEDKRPRKTMVHSINTRAGVSVRL